MLRSVVKMNYSESHRNEHSCVIVCIGITQQFTFFTFVIHYRSISWMIPAVPGQNATGHVAVALLMSFPQTCLAQRATSNWSGEPEQSTDQGSSVSTLNYNIVLNVRIME